MTADNLQMITAAALATNDTATARLYFPLMHQFADYLVDYGLDPTLQLCSDDFEGPTAHNANLVAKSIVGIGAFGLLCEALGRHDLAPHYHAVAKTYAEQWVVLSRGGRNGASTRDYNATNTWSLKYNLIWDRVFGLHLFDDAIARECAFVMASDSPVRQKYGWYYGVSCV